MCYKKLRKLKVAQSTYYSTMIGDLGKEMSLLIGPDATFIRKGSDLANRAGHYIYW